ncbi:hypothetical protein, partial [Aeromonas sp. HMWF017]|uniref:hypothetical protein n=1 Tax=Aeromonas sp. HMWF017 TaxID=2056853 RepID=UPI001C62C77C
SGLFDSGIWDVHMNTSWHAICRKVRCRINSTAIYSQKKWDPALVLLKVLPSDPGGRNARKDALQT